MNDYLLFVLACPGEAEVDRVNRDLVAHGYSGYFENGDLVGPFVHKEDGDWVNHGLCTFQPNDLYMRHPNNFVVLVSWLWNHETLLHPTPDYDYLKNDFIRDNPNLYHYITQYNYSLSHLDRYNQELNATNQLVLPKLTIRYLFGIQDKLKHNGGVLVPGIRESLSSLCSTYHCRFEVRDGVLYFGRDVLLSCERSLYIDEYQYKHTQKHLYHQDTQKIIWEIG